MIKDKTIYLVLISLLLNIGLIVFNYHYHYCLLAMLGSSAVGAMLMVLSYYWFEIDHRHYLRDAEIMHQRQMQDLEKIELRILLDAEPVQNQTKTSSELV